jgi:hypothetical protein
VVSFSKLLSKEAALDDDDNSGGMDMVYYLSVNANNTAANSGDEVANTSDLLSKKLSDESCSIAGVVYLAFNNYLLFDRYRGGIVMSNSELQSLMQGDKRRFRSTSFISEDENDNKDAQEEHAATLLPSHVLEYILRFLPDAAVASMSRVFIGT